MKNLLTQVIAAVLGTVLLTGCTKKEETTTVETTTTEAPDVVGETTTGASVPSTPSWNSWVQESSKRADFSPREFLHPKQDYNLFLDLSLLSYEVPGTASLAPGQAFEDVIRQELQVPAKEIRFKVLLLADPAFFRTASRIEDLVLDRDRVRRWVEGKALSRPTDFAAAFRGPTAPDFLLGGVRFPLSVGERTGSTNLGISLWFDNRPVEEFRFTTCVKDQTGECPPASLTGGRAFEGFDHLSPSEAPDGALHLVDIEDGELMRGVWHRKNATEYFTWPLKLTRTELVKYFDDTIRIQLLERAAGGAAVKPLSQVGGEILDTLFPEGEGSPSLEMENARQAARNAFLAFCEEHFREPHSDERPGPALFIRFVPSNAAYAPILPYGLMAVRPTANASPEHLGFHFRVETPLTQQWYDAASPCIQSWRVMFPPETAPKPVGVASKKARKLRQIRAGDPSFACEPIEPFQEWISKGDSSPSTALVILSHYAKDVFYEKEGNNQTALIPGDVKRKFARPSLAILNACGTGGPASFAFIQALNEHGARALIVTSASVPADLAGDFLDSLAAVLEKQGEQETSLSELFRLTLQKLRNKKDDTKFKYGPRVLTYSLVGDGGVRVCGRKKNS